MGLCPVCVSKTWSVPLLYESHSDIGFVHMSQSVLYDFMYMSHTLSLFCPHESHIGIHIFFTCVSRLCMIGPCE